MNKSHWQLVDLYPGAHIRVQTPNYYHHGIYIGNDEVVQFGLPNGAYSDWSEIKVLRSTIADFCGGENFIEVYVYDRKERKRKKSDEQIVNIALSKVGEGGYHLLYNNCEHFANFCVFGEASSGQIDEIYSNVQKLLNN